MPITIPHLHLLLNHIPTVGSLVGLGLLLLALVRRNDEVLRASLEVLFIIAVLTLPVYLTGVAADEIIENMQGVSVADIRTHETAALLAFIWMQVAGFVAWLAVWQSRRTGRPSNGMVRAVLVLSIITNALMARAATLGGGIRHPEIGTPQEPQAAAAAASWLSGERIGEVVTQVPWIWPAAETLHFLGLALAFGVLLTVNLRILGAMRGIPFSAVHRLLPWGMLGFGLNLITGMLFFIAASSQYTENIAFYWKAGALGLAGAHFLYLTVLDKTWAIQAGQDAGALEKLVAVFAIAAWVGVIFWGRMLPFIGNAF